MENFVIGGATLFDGERFFQGDLAVKNGFIADVGALSESYAGFPRLDFSNCIATSGLVDLHVHLSETGNTEFGFYGDLETVPFGVLYAVDACAEQTDINRLHSLCAQTAVFICPRRNGGEIDEQKTDELLSLYGEKAIGVKVYFDGDLNKGVSIEFLKSACAYARARGLKVMVHSTFSPVPMQEIVETLSAGDILTHCYHGAPHTIEENNFEAYRKAKEKGVVLDAGMAGGVHTDFKVLKTALEKGFFPDTISSDITKFSAYKRGGVYSLLMCMSIMRFSGMDEKEIFKAVTINAAKAAGKEREWFSFQKGAPANLTVLQYGEFQTDMTDRWGHRVRGEKGYLCKMTVKNGKILYRN